MKQEHETSQAEPVFRAEAQQPWLRPLAKGLGRAARLLTSGFDKVAGPAGPDRSAAAAQALDDLLRRLGTLVGSHAAAGFVYLRDEPEFWRLVERIHRLRHERGSEHEPGSARGAEDIPASASDAEVVLAPGDPEDPAEAAVEHDAAEPPESTPEAQPASKPTKRSRKSKVDQDG